MRYAYATFLMRGDGYLPGALVLAYALKMQTKNECIAVSAESDGIRFPSPLRGEGKQSTKFVRADCICLVTSDVSEKARLALRVLYNEVIFVDELHFSKTATGGRCDRKILPTRFQALNLCEYDKIILLDADVLPLYDYDLLFQLKTPAGIIMEEKNACYAGGAENSQKWSWHALYEPICPHGTRIPKEITDRVRNDPQNMGVNSGLWVITPSMEEFEALRHALNTTESYTKNFPWPEMQLATMLWSGRWTNIDIRYCSIGGYPRLDALWGIHYAGPKPWQTKHRSISHYAKFPDFRIWYEFFNAMYVSHAEFHEMPLLRRLWEFSKNNPLPIR